jgi:hypothetical protein
LILQEEPGGQAGERQSNCKNGPPLADRLRCRQPPAPALVFVGDGEGEGLEVGVGDGLFLVCPGGSDTVGVTVGSDGVGLGLDGVLVGDGSINLGLGNGVGSMPSNATCMYSRQIAAGNDAPKSCE